MASICVTSNTLYTKSAPATCIAQETGSIVQKKYNLTVTRVRSQVAEPGSLPTRVRRRNAGNFRLSLERKQEEEAMLRSKLLPEWFDV